MDVRSRVSVRVRFTYLQPFQDVVSRRDKKRVHASLVTVDQPEFNLKDASDDTFVFQAANEDLEAVHNPDQICVGVTNPGKGHDKLLHVGNCPHPGQVGQGGENHHRIRRVMSNHFVS